MNRPIIPALLSALGLFLGCATAPPEGVTPVRGFEPERYLGRWYEIARLDHRFERGLTHVTATYTRRDDGGIDVLNRGYDAEAGEWKTAEGRAYFLKGETVGSLKVSFFGPFYGGYHVMALDKAAYAHALVCGPSRSYLWILARSPSLPPETIRRLITMAEAHRFPVEELIFLDHEHPPSS